MWSVGERRWWDLDTTLWLKAWLNHWLHYLGCSHFNLKKPPGLCRLWWKGGGWRVGGGEVVFLMSCLHNLTKDKISCMNISFPNEISPPGKHTLSCKYRSACHLGRAHASYRESGNWCVSSPQGPWGDGPSSPRCPKGSWFLVQSLYVCCSEARDTHRREWKINIFLKMTSSSCFKQTAHHSTQRFAAL